MINTKRVLLVTSFVIFLTSFIFAASTITTSGGATSYSVDEDVGFIYNISVNNTDTNFTGNITNVNITFSSNLFSFIDGSNGTDAGTHTFTNTSTILTWTNDGLVMNLTTQYFWFNATVSTPGNYNLTITTTNATQSVSTNISVTINDTTNPSITSFSCTPSSVYTGSTVTCSCSGSDAGSGVASTSFTASPSTSTVGTSTQTCIVTDIAGNTISSTITFDITNRPSSPAVSSSSTATSFWTGTTYTTTENTLESGFTKEVAVKQRVKVRVDNEDHHVGLKSITSTSATIEIASDPIEITLDIGEDTKADVNDDGIYDIYVILNNIIGGKADITIKKISESVPEGIEESVETTGEITTPGEETPTETEKSYAWLWVVGILVILIGIGYKFKDKFI